MENKLPLEKIDREILLKKESDTNPHFGKLKLVAKFSSAEISYQRKLNLNSNKNISPLF